MGGGGREVRGGGGGGGEVGGSVKSVEIYCQAVTGFKRLDPLRCRCNGGRRSRRHRASASLPLNFIRSRCSLSWPLKHYFISGRLCAFTNVVCLKRRVYVYNYLCHCIGCTCLAV